MVLKRVIVAVLVSFSSNVEQERDVEVEEELWYGRQSVSCEVSTDVGDVRRED